MIPKEWFLNSKLARFAMRYFLFSVFFLLWGAVTSVSATDSTVFTLWPVLDYRASENIDYSSTHILGPFIKYETKKDETEYALRPLFYRAVDNSGRSRTDVLYPLLIHKKEKDRSSIQVFSILNYDFGEPDSGSRNRSYFFPFLFYGEEEQGKYFAFFPIRGTLYNWFGRDRISFTLFPLYSRTERGTQKIDNILWPFFAKIGGENESGFKFWPFYGQSQKEGVYRKAFFLWPIFFSERTDLDTDDPVTLKAAWPFYINKESRTKSYQAYLWPFFFKTADYEKGYSSWNAPWPLIKWTKGERRYGKRILPFYADETVEENRKRWFLWPIYKIEELNSDLVERRRDRILFFLYSDTKEVKWETGDSLRRISLWPLFNYVNKNGVQHFHVFSLLEPFFPENESIERLWSPLWRIYQKKWDQQGNAVVSFFWNLYWSETRGDQIAWELFPLIKYQRESETSSEFVLLKGLFSYKKGSQGKEASLFYLPWCISWDRT